MHDVDLGAADGVLVEWVESDGHYHGVETPAFGEGGGGWAGCWDEGGRGGGECCGGLGFGFGGSSRRIG